jgi:site-specific recombinase XerD
VLTEYLQEKLSRAPIIGDINKDSVREFRLFLSRKSGVDGEMKVVTQGYYIIALRSLLKWCIKNDVKCLAPEKLDVPKNKEHSLKFLDEDQIYTIVINPSRVER